MLTDDRVEEIVAAGVKSGEIPWAGFKPDAEGKHTLPVLSKMHIQLARAIESEVRKDDEALIESLLKHIEETTCPHEITHRGGINWEICDDCGAKWADDQGGKPAFKWPKAVIAARARLEKAP